MIQVELTPEEQQLLTSMLERQLLDLHSEIGGTDRPGYKEMLKNRKKLLTQMLEKMREIQETKSH